MRSFGVFIWPKKEAYSHHYTTQDLPIEIEAV